MQTKMARELSGFTPERIHHVNMSLADPLSAATPQQFPQAEEIISMPSISNRRKLVAQMREDRQCESGKAQGSKPAEMMATTFKVGKYLLVVDDAESSCDVFCGRKEISAGKLLYM